MRKIILFLMCALMFHSVNAQKKFSIGGISLSMTKEACVAKLMTVERLAYNDYGSMIVLDNPRLGNRTWSGMELNFGEWQGYIMPLRAITLAKYFKYNEESLARQFYDKLASEWRTYYRHNEESTQKLKALPFNRCEAFGDASSPEKIFVAMVYDSQKNQWSVVGVVMKEGL